MQIGRQNDECTVETARDIEAVLVEDDCANSVLTIIKANNSLYYISFVISVKDAYTHVEIVVWQDGRVRIGA